MKTVVRLEQWNEVVAEAFKGTHVDADSSEFNGQLASCSVNDLKFVWIDAESSRVERWRDGYPARRSGKALIHLQAGGVAVTNQHGRAVTITTGDAVLCDPDLGYWLDFRNQYQMFVVEVPVASIAARDPGFDIEETGGRALDPWRSRLLLSFLRSVWEQFECHGHDPEWRECVSRVGLDLAINALTGSIQHWAPGVSVTLRKAVLSYVREHLQDPTLRIASVGTSLGVSRRSVQSVFERMSTTASAFILEQRLARAAEWMRQAPGKQSITEIAFSCGFSDSAYFSRCFHRKFGMAPRDYMTGEALGLNNGPHRLRPYLPTSSDPEHFFGLDFGTERFCPGRGPAVAKFSKTPAEASKTARLAPRTVTP